MQKFNFGAALQSEKTQKACRTNQCKSFVQIVYGAENVDQVGVYGNMLSFICTSFRVLEKESSPNWQDVFSCEENGNRVKIHIANGYVAGHSLEI